MKFPNSLSLNYCNYSKLLRKAIFLTLSLSSLTYIADEANAATFLAEINDFNLTMPDVITNKFAFTLSTGTEQNTQPRGGSISVGNASADFTLFTVSGFPDQDPPVERQITGGSAFGSASPEGSSESFSQAALFGRLGNPTGLDGFPPAEDIPLTFDLNFNYNLNATANLALENASAGYQVGTTGLGTPDAACTPLSLTIQANNSQNGNVTCNFSTVLTAGEFRDFDIQVKVFGNAVAVDVPPPPDIPVEPPVDIVPTPEPTSTISLLSLGILGVGATLKRKVKRTNSVEKEPTKVG